MSARRYVTAHRRLLESSGGAPPSDRMSGKKRELEIVFNLLWNHRPLNADDRSNVVGMYDVPSTTLTWEKFKAYLLKNSGSPCADIEVTYIDSDNKEVVIDSQEKYLLVMYAFRKRARIGDIITLKLDKVTTPQKKKMKSDSEPDVAEEPPFIIHEMPPPWFTKYMKTFKKELLQEVSCLVSRNVSKLSVPKESSSSSARKLKTETSHKKPRKHSSTPTQTVSVGSGELKKYMKFESKLEKLEQKSLKIKAKKLALKVKEPPTSAKRLIGMAPTDVELFMNATPVDNHMPTAPRMLGGEVYLQQWKVTNSGEIPWSYDTQLKLAWGSKELVPIDKTVACPHLMPGEEGQVSVLLCVPVTPGRYECYWHLHHNGVRFGHWLGCFVIVDEPPIKPHLLAANKETAKNDQVSASNIEQLFSEKLKIEMAGQEQQTFSEKKDSGEGSSRSSSVSNASYVFVNNDEERKRVNREEEEEEEAERDASSEEDIEKVGNEEEDEKKESDENNEEECNGGLDVDENIAPEYAYIVYNGAKFPVHKKFLTEECFQRSEKVENTPLQELKVSSTPPEQTIKEELQDSKKAKERTASESSGSRLFVFPQHSPGFEVVYPEEKNDYYLDVTVESNSPESRENNELDTSTASSVQFTYSFPKCTCPTVHKPRQCFETPFPFNTGPCDCNYCADEDYSSWEQPEYVRHCCKHLKHPHHRNSTECNHLPDCAFHHNQVKANYPSARLVRQEESVQSEQQHTSGTFQESPIQVQSEQPSFNVTFRENPEPQAFTTNNAFRTRVETTPIQIKQKQHEFYMNSLAGPVQPQQEQQATTLFQEQQNFQQRNVFGEQFERPNPGSEQQQQRNVCGDQIDRANDNSSFHSPAQSCCGNSGSFYGSLPTRNSIGEVPMSESVCSGRSHSHRHSLPQNRKPENLITGAAILASSALSTARSMMDMVLQTGGGKWVNGHWVVDNPNTKRENGLRLLAEMGFMNRDLNATLLARYNDDVHRVISELIL